MGQKVVNLVNDCMLVNLYKRLMADFANGGVCRVKLVYVAFSRCTPGNARCTPGEGEWR